MRSNGVSGVGPITLFDSSRLLVHIACEIKGFRPENYMEPKDVRRRDRYEQLALRQQRKRSPRPGLQVDGDERGRVGVVISSAIGGIDTIHDMVVTAIKDGPRRISPFPIPMLMSNGAAGLISIDYGFHGPSFSVASACASGVDGIGMAWMMLRAGMIDVAIAGASEATITEVGVAAFDRVGAMSRRKEDYSMSPRSPST